MLLLSVVNCNEHQTTNNIFFALEKCDESCAFFLSFSESQDRKGKISVQMKQV